MSTSRFYFGIDLGTTNSVAACYDAAKGTCKTLMHHMSPLVKSQLWLDEQGVERVGSVPKTTRSIGDSVKDVKSSMLLNSKFELGKEVYTAVQVSSKILAELKEVINKEYAEQVGHEITDVTITVPAAFNNIQRMNTLKAAKLAGLNVISLINEPTAAALAYADDVQHQETVLIFDLGGGTFDVSIVTLSPKIPALRLPKLGIDLPTLDRQMVNVLRSDGDTHLGGNDLDWLMVDIACKAVRDDIVLNKSKLREAMDKAQHVKEQDGTIVEVVTLDTGENIIIDDDCFMQASDIIFNRTDKIVKKLLSTVGATSIDRIVFVGGSTKNKYICSRVAGNHPGVPTYNNINPDECVAIGAARNSYIMSGADKSMSFTDIVTGSVGILVKLDTSCVFQKMLSKGEPLPALKTLFVQKSTIDQSIIKIPVYQGENVDYKLNQEIGSLTISDIPEDVSLEDNISCTLKINKSGVLNVTARLRDKEYSTEIDISSIVVQEEEPDELIDELEEFITNEFI